MLSLFTQLAVEPLYVPQQMSRQADCMHIERLFVVTCNSQEPEGCSTFSPTNAGNREIHAQCKQRQSWATSWVGHSFEFWCRRNNNMSRPHAHNTRGPQSTCSIWECVKQEGKCSLRIHRFEQRPIGGVCSGSRASYRLNPSLLTFLMPWIISI